ncbi:hypothetical protein G6F64_014971 [Rhizopus arrhizus]|uniref:Uncharacterized protein n=1 Tax=Rhizopus oryzae TaxID=64495 RepID=A0A9P7BIZ6_RHIOR|nr:hypothetical protein G6F64_014971 [Rhizopus arrhizus]
MTRAHSGGSTRPARASASAALARRWTGGAAAGGQHGVVGGGHGRFHVAARDHGAGRADGGEHRGQLAVGQRNRGAFRRDRVHDPARQGKSQAEQPARAHHHRRQPGR